MPSYNHGDYIGRAITSVLNQTYSNLEIIIIDNCSTDHTARVVSEFNDSRLKLLKINNNGVIAKSRNVGIQRACGDWIAFLDSDDWWVEDKLMKCLTAIDNDVDLIFHDLQIFPNKHWLPIKRLIKGRKLNAPVLRDLLIYGNVIPNSSVVVRKKLLTIIEGIAENENLIAAEDYHTWLKISRVTNQFVYLPKQLGFYTNHNDSMSRKDMSKPSRYAVKSFLHTLNGSEKNITEANLKYSSGRYNYLNGNTKVARNEFIFTLRNGLFYLKVKSFIMLLIISLNLGVGRH